MESSHRLTDIVTGVITLLLTATRRIRMPISISLVFAGMALTALTEALPEFLPNLHEVRLSPGLVMFVFLPPPLFESAFHLDVRLLRRNLAPVMLLAVPGLLLYTLLIGLLVSWATAIPFSSALLLGAILSATDPVAVVGLF